MRTFVVLLALSSLACTRDNPAFDDLVAGTETSASTTKPDSTSSGDGDGDPSTGDGDGDPTTTTTTTTTDPGDGDGDGGDGDGDGGDGDGDGGDGDGEPGDGDGDVVDPLCDPGPLINEKLAFSTSSLGFIDTAPAPGFHQAPFQCHTFVICSAAQVDCNGDTNYIALGHSNGDVFFANGDNMDPVAIKLVFLPGPMPCGQPLELDPSQFFVADYWVGEWAELAIRLPCYEQYGVPLYIATDGSTFWDPELTEPAALAD